MVFRDHVLAAAGFDEAKGERFFRPLGGEVEFGEAAADAAMRELREEVGRGIEVRAALGVVENRFTYRDAPGHEVVFEFIAAFAAGEEPSTLDPIECREGDATFTARWLPLAEVLAGAHRIYPDGLPNRIAAWVNAL